MVAKKFAREDGNLRIQAEKVLQGKYPDAAGDADDLQPGKARRLLHELRVHQIELEIQNEELQRAQLELEASRAEYFDLYELAPTGYLILDQHGLIRKANLTAARLLGLEKSALFGEPLARFIAREDQDSYYLGVKKLLKEGGQKVFEMGMTRTGGAGFCVQMEMAAAGGEGEAPGCRVVIVDVTERKQAEEALHESEEKYRILSEQLQESDRRKDEFLGMLSHEIRNPLASIMLNLALLNRFEPGSEKAGKAKEIMNRQAKQLSRLVDDLLDVTRIARGKIELKKEPVELNELVHHTVEDYREAFREKEVVLELQPAIAELYVEADPARITQMVGNLLHNAVRFTEAGGHARLSLTEDTLRKCAVIRVEDSGAGISPEMLRNLFTPFIQADTSLDRNSNGSGLGLGLALVKGLTELHGGEVCAHSDGLGQGAVFTVNLPLLTSPVYAPADESAATVPCRSLRILVIEDIKDVADSLEALLVEDGHEVMVVYDGNGGLDGAKKFRPDIVLCDIGLPGMDGYQVARAFRADDDLKNVCMVSLTGYARPEDIRKAKEAGFHHHLAKPAEPEKIREVLGHFTKSF